MKATMIMILSTKKWNVENKDISNKEEKEYYYGDNNYYN